MPKSKVTARRVVRRGKAVWRVIIPLDLSGGKRKTRYFRKKSDATDFASDCEDNRSGCVAEFMVLSRDMQAAAVRAARLAGSPAELERAVADYLRNGSTTDILLRDAVIECLKAKRLAGLRKRSLQSLSSTLIRFAEVWGSELVSAITLQRVQGWLANPKWSARTRRGYGIDLRTFFSFAKRQGWCARNVADDLQRPLVDEKPPGILSVRETAALLFAAMKTDGGLIPFLAVQLFAGLRPEAEASRILWSDLTGSELRVRSVSAKTRKRRLVPINDTLKRWLAWGAMVGQLPPRNVAKRMRALRVAAGVKWSHDCLRHSFVSYALPAYGAETVSGWAGHSEDVLFANYRELVTAEEASRFFGLTPASCAEVASA